MNEKFSIGLPDFMTSIEAIKNKKSTEVEQVVTDSNGNTYKVKTDIDELDSKVLEASQKVTKGNHAELRSSQGRNVSNAINDLEKARPSDILIQDDGRFLIRGANGRIHVIEANGEIVTTMNKVTNSNVQQRINSGRWSRLTLEQEEAFKNNFSNYINWK